MDRKKLPSRIAYLVFFIFVVNTLAMKFHWYYSIWWFDMPMHFLGGFWLALATAWTLGRVNVSPSILKVLLGVVIVGLGWEFFEVLAYNSPLDAPFNTTDTLSDICFDLAGGLAALFFLPTSPAIIENNV